SIALAGFSANAAEVLWYGHAATKITTEEGKVILIDPYISNNPATPEDLRDLSQIGQVDLILITHGHGDHVGDLAALAEQTGAQVATNADLARQFVDLGWVAEDKLIRFNKSGTITPLGDGIRVVMVPAEHSSDLYHDGKLLPGGEPVGYVIELENGFRIYHAGDTGVFLGMELIGAFYAPDLALLPIGGHFTMDPEDAAWALDNLLLIPQVIPIHYGTFGAIAGTPEQLKDALGESDIEVIDLKPGESRTFTLDDAEAEAPADEPADDEEE